MRHTTANAVGRRALIKGTAMLALSAAPRAQAQAPTPEAVTRLEDVPLGPAVRVTVERRGDIVLVGLNRPFIQNRIDPPTRLRVAAAFYDYEHDPSLRALVLLGHGEHFSRGIDVDAAQAGILSGRRSIRESSRVVLDE
jgi:Enoyl-CoA hydratase/isomerase